MLLFVGLRWQALDIPLERDEGEYAYIAQRLLHGEVPYRDAFDQKPPAIFLAYLVPIALCGASVTAIHGFLALWNAGSALFVYLIARNLAGRLSAAFAVLAFALLSIDVHWLATAANTESFMILPMTAAVWCALHGASTGLLRWWFPAGFLSLAACLFKQVAATNVGLIAVLILYPQIIAAVQPNLGRMSRAAGVFLAGGITALLPIVAWFMLAGAWRDVIECVIWHNVRYAQSVPLPAGLTFLALMLLNQSESQVFLWIFAAATGFDWRNSSRRTALVTGIWLVCSFLGVSAGLYFRAHYFIQLAPVLAVMIGCAAGKISTRFARSAAPGRLFAMSLVTGLLLSVPYLNAQRFLWPGIDADTRGRMIYGQNPFPESARFAEKIRAETAADDSVLIFGSEPQILFLAERRSATRYIFLYPAMMNIPGALERQHEIIQEIRERPPRVILMTDLQMSLLKTPQTPSVLENHVNWLLANGYRLVGLRLFDGWDFLLLADAAAQETWRQHQSHQGSGENSPRIDMRLYVKNQ